MRKEIIDPGLQGFLRVIGENIRKLRGTMNQFELGKLAQVSRSTIQAAELEKPISISNLYKIAIALNVHPGQLCIEEISGETFRKNFNKAIVEEMSSEIFREYFKKIIREIMDEILVTQIPPRKS